jgi:hypothetical protein
MRRLSVAAAVVCAVAGPGLVAAPASAQGQTERGPEHANSICSFSGLNDEPDDPFEGGRVQSYGAIVAAGHLQPRFVKSGPPSPGFFCNGHRFPREAWAE